MVKKILILILLLMPITSTSCTWLSETNEKVKGDGVPYIPGILKFFHKILVEFLKEL